MGRKDWELKQEIRTFLQIAWEKWVADISDYPKSDIKISPSKSSADGESETDHDALQSERLMAQDEYDDDFSPSEEIFIPIFFEELDNGEWIVWNPLKVCLSEFPTILQVGPQ